MKNMRYLYYVAIALSLLIPQVAAYAQDLPGLTWSDRVSKETEDGDIEEITPYVEIETIRLSRFSHMQSLALEDTVRTGADDNAEMLYVFRGWQGGARQGEQLMLVVISAQGVDVIGPHSQDFESLDVISPQDDFGPIFELYGADKDKPLARLEYFSGELLASNEE